jgi:hypothetical protein
MSFTTPQLMDVDGFADVVGGRAEQHRPAIERQAGELLGQRLRQLPRHVMDGAQVCGEPGWRVKGLEKIVDLVRQRAERRLAGVW